MRKEKKIFFSNLFITYHLSYHDKKKKEILFSNLFSIYYLSYHEKRKRDTLFSIIKKTFLEKRFIL